MEALGLQPRRGAAQPPRPRGFDADPRGCAKVHGCACGAGGRGGGRVGGRRWFPGPWSAALRCSRAPPPHAHPRAVPSAGGGRRQGTRSPRLHKGAGVSAPLAGAARPGGCTGRSGRARGRGGLARRPPPSAGGRGAGKSLGACQEHSAHNNLAENTAASASKKPRPCAIPAGRYLPGPTQCLTSPGVFPLFPSGSCTWPSSMKRRPSPWKWSLK